MLRKIFIDRVLKNRIFKTNFVEKEDFNDSLTKSKKILSYDKKIKTVFLNKKSIIPNNLIGRRIFVHSGKEIVSLKILPSMLGFKVGEFFFNKKIRNTK